MRRSYANQARNKINNQYIRKDRIKNQDYEKSLCVVDSIDKSD